MCRVVKAVVRALSPWAVAALLSAAHAQAADQPYRIDDIALGASMTALAATLDLRGIEAALAERRGRPGAQPDLGRRGFGCYRRDDAYADVACVSHDERIDGVATREVRLQFVDGRLQQFSITADLPHREAVFAALETRHGPPQAVIPAAPGRYASWQWHNAVSSIQAYAGGDVVFVSFELAGYQAAVRRRQDPRWRPGQIVVEPR